MSSEDMKLYITTNIAYRQKLWHSADFFKFPEAESRNSVVTREPDRLKAPSLSSRTEQLG